MLSPRVEHHARRDRGLVVVDGLVSGFNYFVHSPSSARIAVTTEEDNGGAPAEVPFYDKYAYLTKLAILSAMLGIITISIGKQPHCPDGCQKKSCTDSPIDDDDYGGTLQTKSGRCSCSKADGSEYCAKQEQSTMDKALFFGAFGFFGVAVIVFAIKLALVYYWGTDNRGGLAITPTDAVIVSPPRDGDTNRTTDTTNSENVSMVEIVCPYTSMSMEGLYGVPVDNMSRRSRSPKREIPVIVAVAV